MYLYPGPHILNELLEIEKPFFQKASAVAHILSDADKAWLL